MGKLAKQDPNLGKKLPPPTTIRGQAQNGSLLALAPPIAATYDNGQEQEGKHPHASGPKGVAASLKHHTDKDEKKQAAKTASRGTVAKNPDTKKVPGVIHDESGPEEGGFLASKQRFSGGSAGRRSGQKKKLSHSDIFAPGAVLIPGSNHGHDASEDNDIDDMNDKKIDDDDTILGVDFDDGGTLIVAAQVVNNDDDENLNGEKMETKIQEEVESRLKMHNQNLVVVDAVVAVKPDMDDEKKALEPKILGLTRKMWCLLLFLILLVIGIVTGLLVSSKSDSPLEPIDLRTVVLETYENTSAFENPESPQSLALAWLLQDNFTASLSQGNGTTKILERYALAVFYYSTDGVNWDDDMKFLSSNDTCSWNNGLIRRSDEEQGLKGAHCQSALAVDLLQFHDDGLSGTLPTELRLLTDLVFLNLTSDSIVGTIPTELGELTTLRWFNLANTSLTGTLPTEIGALTGLVKLSLGECNLEGSLPTELGSLAALTQLDLFDNSFNGTLPTELGGCTSMEKFNVYNNNFFGTLPVELMVQWTELLSLAVDSNRLRGTLPTELGQLTALEVIGLNSNLFTGTIPTEVGLVTSLRYLDVGTNSFNGTLPSELGQFTNMTTFTVNSNAFTGTLPTELGNLTAMTVFDVSVNKLAGTLPTELGEWNSLESFLAYQNDLTGTLPTELGAWNSLVDLSVYRNSLIGTIPTEFGRLGALMTLDISVNALTGVLPTELSQLSDLVQFSFYQNNFTGSVSNILCTESREWDILEGDCSVDGTTGQVEIECTCCTACCNVNESACI